MDLFLIGVSLQSPRPKYSPLPDNIIKPDPEEVLNKVKMYLPNASILKSKFILSDVNDQVTTPLTVTSPVQKLEKFKTEHTCIIDSCNCAIFLCTTIFVIHQKNVKKLNN
ncbi:hypothetical protein ACF0H5_007122 [Mactra antiquata]